jgi:hypothetical protein
MVALTALLRFRTRRKMGDRLMSHAGPLIQSLALSGTAAPTWFNNDAAKFRTGDPAHLLSRSGYLSPYTIQCYQVMPEPLRVDPARGRSLLGDNKVDASFHH